MERLGLGDDVHQRDGRNPQRRGIGLHGQSELGVGGDRSDRDLRHDVCPPTDIATYPVSITTAGSSPPAFKVFDSAGGSGLGTVTIGGHGAANPIGWWVKVPAVARAGTYTSTVTMAITSGP